jgi:hypothetical protein
MAGRTSRLLKKGSGIGETLYDGAASFGVAVAWISLFIGGFIGLALIGLGIYLILRKAKFSGKVDANVTDAECKRIIGGKSSTNDCLLNLHYEVKEEVYNSVTTTNSSTYYQPGTTTTIRYDPDNPKDVTMMPGTKLIGWILIGVGVFITIAVIIHWYLATRYKFAAAATGVGTGFNMAT